MIDLKEPTYPKNNPCLQPNLMVIDAGYSIKNHEKLLSIASVHLKNKDLDNECNFNSFFNLYDELKLIIPNVRDALPEFGFSPYNLMLVINSLDLHKDDFASKLGCSYSKIMANTTKRNNDYFRPMVGNQWQDLLTYYQKMVAISDEYHNLHHDPDKLFFMRANPNLPLSIPSHYEELSTE